MEYSGSGRDHAQVAEGLLAPAQEPVAFHVALELPAHVDLHRIRAPGRIDLDRVIDHQVDRDERVDPRRVAAQTLDRVAHRRQIHHARHAGEILQEQPARFKRKLFAFGGLGLPEGELRHVLLGDFEPVAVAQEVFEQDPDRERHPREIGREVRLLQCGQPVDRLRTAAEVDCSARAERILQFRGSHVFLRGEAIPADYSKECGGCGYRNGEVIPRGAKHLEELVSLSLFHVGVLTNSKGLYIVLLYIA